MVRNFDQKLTLISTLSLMYILHDFFVEKQTKKNPVSILYGHLKSETLKVICFVLYMSSF